MLLSVSQHFLYSPSNVFCSFNLFAVAMWMIGDLAFLFDWGTYPAFPYNASRIHEIHKMKFFFIYFSTSYTPGLRLTLSTCLNKCAIRQLQCQVEEHSSEYPLSLELLGWVNLDGRSAGEWRWSLPGPRFSKSEVVSLFGCAWILAL